MLPKNCRNLAVSYLVTWLPYLLCCELMCHYSGVYATLAKLPLSYLRSVEIWL